jgi:hypothetical protein
MPLTNREAFKFGFLQKCALAGLSDEDIISLATKLAEEIEKRAGVVGSTISGVSRLASSGLSTLGSYAIPAALLAPPAAGALGGYGLAKLMDSRDIDADEIKNRELAEEYERQAQRIRKRKALAAIVAPTSRNRLLL